MMSAEPQAACGEEIDIPLIADLLSCSDYKGAADKGTWLSSKLLLNDRQIRKAAAATVEQRKSNLWSALRKLRFTSSNFEDILRAEHGKGYGIVMIKFNEIFRVGKNRINCTDDRYRLML